ncbi:MAG: type sorting protein [Flaviaesturariibacter sp.]|nr:type sorting protein [Flaviaesturariibacter sp.]
MKKTVTILLALLGCLPAFARHVVGGEMIYEYMSTNANGSKHYRVTLKLFRDNHNCTAADNCAELPNSVAIAVYNNDNNSAVPGFGPTFVIMQKKEAVPIIAQPPCLSSVPEEDYSVGYYPFEIDLPPNAAGYTAVYQTCCRVLGIANVLSTSTSTTGVTYNCILPGTTLLPATETNSGPQFKTGISILCQNKPFVLDFGATDPNPGDSLVYTLCDAYDGGAATNASFANPGPPSSVTPPQYPSAPYFNGYTGSTPLGNNATINPRTGLITGVAPAAGEYVVCVCINEYRDGHLIGFHRKDFIIEVSDCSFPTVELPLSYSKCKDSTFSFSNQALEDATIHSHRWDFGDGNSSTAATPSHTYADTGTYVVTLTVNQGEACVASGTTLVRVYPGFDLGFTIQGICATKPTQFRDTTSPRFGAITSWRWDFGDLATQADTSHLRNPVYSYPVNGVKNVELIVSTSKGCLDTLIKAIEILDKPPINLPFRDTLICNGDTLQLHAEGFGAFSWTPNTRIINPNSPDPRVYPQATTFYKVQLNDNGCLNSDSIKVRVVDFVTLSAIADQGICLTDSVQLGATTNGLQYLWTPSADFSNPTLLAPFAHPTAALNQYVIRATIGHCSTTDTVVVRTSPYPIVNAGIDTTICFRTPVTLRGTHNGTSFTWSPASTLANANTLTPTATPSDTTAYVLTVFDNSGFCPKPSRDTVIVRVVPKIKAFAGRDTAVVVGQPLQLNASGGVRYVWTPATALSNTGIFNPIGLYNGSFDSIRYTVEVFSAEGCRDSATVGVKIFKTVPSIFVPTGFTPNGDGRNDVARPIAVGIKSIDYFRVYNRWGQLVFETTQNGKGWDGRINGKDQATNVFVWLVKAVDYTGKPYVNKGTVTLIR